MRLAQCVHVHIGANVVRMLAFLQMRDAAGELNHLDPTRD